MSRTRICIASWMVATALLAHAGDEKPRTFHGQIADTQCALNIHSLTRSHAGRRYRQDQAPLSRGTGEDGAPFR